MSAWLIALALAAGGEGALALPGIPELGAAYAAVGLAGALCATEGEERVCRLPALPQQPWHGIAVTSRILAFRGGTLVRGSLEFDERRFEALRQALRQQLGAGETGSDRLRTGMGGIFYSRFEIWHIDGQVVLLEQYFGRVTRSAVTLMQAPEFDRLQVQRDARRIRGARDL